MSFKLGTKKLSKSINRDIVLEYYNPIDNTTCSIELLENEPFDLILNPVGEGDLIILKGNTLGIKLENIIYPELTDILDMKVI